MSLSIIMPVDGNHLGDGLLPRLNHFLYPNIELMFENRN